MATKYQVALRLLCGELRIELTDDRRAIFTLEGQSQEVPISAFAKDAGKIGDDLARHLAPRTQYTGYARRSEDDAVFTVACAIRDTIEELKRNGELAVWETQTL